VHADTDGGGEFDLATQLDPCAPLLPLVAAALPYSRSVQVGVSATAFVTIVNEGDTVAQSVGMALRSSIPAALDYSITDPATNLPTGSPNTPADIPAAGSQTYVVAVTPTAPFDSTETELTFAGATTSAAATIPGVDTLLLSASSTPVPDLVALAATLGNTGVVNIPGSTGTGVFAVATVNVGASGQTTISADTGGTVLPVSLTVCQTDPPSGVCLAPPGTTMTTQINANDTPTFAIFVTGKKVVQFSPATNRIFARFVSGGVTRGATSVAVQTQ